MAKALVAMLGLDRVVAVDAGPGALTVNASGPARGELRLDGRLTAGGLEANVNGTARPFADNPSAALRATIVRADVAPLRGQAADTPHCRSPSRAASRLPATICRSPTSMPISAARPVRGKLEFTLARPHRLQGEIEADNIDGAGLIAAAIGMPASAGNNNMPMATGSGNAAWAWSSEPFADGAFGEFAGQVALKARRLDLLPQLTAREFRATLRLGKDEFAFDDMTGDVAGGRLAGQISFRAAEDGLKARAKVSLTGADAATLLPAGARPPITGSLGLVGRSGGDRLEPGRTDRLVAWDRKDRACRCPIRRPRSARLRCRHPRGGPGTWRSTPCASPTW